MGVPGVAITLLDNQLGQSQAGLGNVEVVIGTSSGGTVANFVPYTTNNPATIQTNSGNGSAPRLAATIANQTGNPVTVCTIPAASPGTNTAVFAATANTGTGTPTLSGTPNDDYYLVITPVNPNAVAYGTAGIIVNVSIDGGATIAYSVNMGTATTITTGSAFTTYTGLTISFGAGTPVTGDSYYAVSSAPTFADAAVQSALQAVAAIKFQTFQDVFVAGVSGAGDVTAFDGYMTTLATTNKRFSRLLCGARDATWGGASTETEAAWITSLTSAFATSSSLRVGVCAGHYRFVDPYTGSYMRSNGIYGAAARDSAVLPSVDLAQVNLGSIPGVVLPPAPDAFAKGKFFYHDEDQTSGLDAARFLTYRQFVGFPGIYITNSNLMAPPGSDFNWLQHGHVIDEAAAIAYQFFTLQLSSPVRVSQKTGFILAQDRLKLQNGCTAALNNALAQQVSALSVVVSTSDNILSTATLTVNIFVVPLGYIKAVNVTIQFVNPALALVA
jgi:hypothetical protein